MAAAKSKIPRGIVALARRDQGMWCAYCATPLALPVAYANGEGGGWELALLPDGEGVWQLADGYAKATRDHVHPLSKGGPDNLDNLVLACMACNVAKGTAPLLLFFARRAGCPRFSTLGETTIADFSRMLAA